MSPSLLDKIMSADRHVCFYALNGLAFTLANEIEDIMFWCFLTASGLSWEQAADKFYARTTFNPKRQMTDEAITAKLAGDASLETWENLNSRIQTLLGDGSNLRNLIGHNPVMISVYTSGELDPDTNSVLIEARPEVRQKKAMVERRSRKPATVGVDEMRDFCAQLIDLTILLQNFGFAVLRGDPTHRSQYVG